MNDLETIMNADTLLAALQDMRKFYNELITVTTDTVSSEEQKREAGELISGGFYFFVSRMIIIASGVDRGEDNKNDED